MKNRRKDSSNKTSEAPKPEAATKIKATLPLPERSDRRGFSYRAPARPEDEVAADASRHQGDRDREQPEESEGTILPAHWKKTG
jgi:hypothetical protein